MSQPTLLFDLDDTIVDLRGPWVRWINESFNLQLTGEDLTDWSIEKCVPRSVGPKVFGFLSLRKMFTELQPLEGAVEALNYLHELDYDIMIASSPARDPDTAADKLRWIKEWLPWMSRRNVFLCARKERIWADAFVDDSPDNLIKYREMWMSRCFCGAGTAYMPEPAEPRIITLDWPFNRLKKVDDVIDLRANSYAEPKLAWVEILNYVLEHLPSSAAKEVRCG